MNEFESDLLHWGQGEIINGNNEVNNVGNLYSGYFPSYNFSFGDNPLFKANLSPKPIINKCNISC